MPISGTMARSRTRITALYFSNKTLSKEYAKILDRSILTSSVTPGGVIHCHQEFLLITRDRMEIEMRKWCQTTCLVKTLRKICILTYLGRNLTLTRIEVRF